jgi:hypothetical protein
MGFLAGLGAGLEVSADAVDGVVDESKLADAFLQLADDWALLLQERIDDSDTWTEVLDDLQMIRLKDCLKRVKERLAG